MSQLPARVFLPSPVLAPVAAALYPLTGSAHLSSSDLDDQEPAEARGILSDRSGSRVSVHSALHRGSEVEEGERVLREVVEAEIEVGAEVAVGVVVEDAGVVDGCTLGGCTEPRLLRAIEAEVGAGGSCKDVGRKERAEAGDRDVDAGVVHIVVGVGIGAAQAAVVDGLGEVFEEHCYRIVAAQVVEVDKADTRNGCWGDRRNERPKSSSLVTDKSQRDG